MKTQLLLFLLICSAISLEAQNVWTQKASLQSTPRRGAFGFSIGTKGYVGGGEDASNNDLADFWEWDQGTNAWTQKMSLNLGRSAAMGYTLNGKGYAVMGFNTNQGGQLNDNWEYDPSTNNWTQKASFPGAGRYGAAGFAIGNKGYIGMGCPGGGNGPPSTDFWQYDPTTNTWTQKASSPMPPRRATVGVGVGNFGYMGFGYDGSITTNYGDWWRYDPSTNTWLQRASLPASTRNYPVVFSMSASAFAGTGYGTSMLSDFWEYNTWSDTWTQRANFGGGQTDIATGFSIGTKGYVAMGWDGINFLTELWEYSPIDLSASSPDLNGVLCSFYPTVVSGTATLEIQNLDHLTSAELRIFDMGGKLIEQRSITETKYSFDSGSLASGAYLYEAVNNGVRIGSGKFIVE